MIANDAFRLALEKHLASKSMLYEDLEFILGSTYFRNVAFGTGHITQDLAYGLSIVFEATTPDYWKNLEFCEEEPKAKDHWECVRLRAACYRHVAMNKVVKAKWLNIGKDSKTIEQNVLKFFGTKSIQARPFLLVPPDERLGDTRYQTAWIRQVQLDAGRCAGRKPFDLKTFRNDLSKVFAVAASADIHRAVYELWSLGIACTILPHFDENSVVDGFTARLPSGNPIIALSMRLKRLEWFWYTLAHALAHIDLGTGGHLEPNVDLDLHEGIQAFIDRWLLPDEELLDVTLQALQHNRYPSRSTLHKMAVAHNISLALVLGRTRQLRAIGYLPTPDRPKYSDTRFKLNLRFYRDTTYGSDSESDSSSDSGSSSKSSNDDQTVVGEHTGSGVEPQSGVELTNSVNCC